MRRRDFIQLAGAGALAAAWPARAQEAHRFAPLLVSPDREIRTVVGLRPYRSRGYVLRTEPLTRRQTVVHNYGHGGSGVTMSWGCARRAVSLALGTGEDRFAVLGGGVMGLTTGLLLARAGFQTTLYASEFSPNTTSNIAAAVWGPSTLFRQSAVTDAFIEMYAQDARVSHLAFRHLADRGGYGVRWIREYHFRRRPPSRPIEPPSESRSFVLPNWTLEEDPARWFGFPAVTHWDALMIDPDIYLPALMRDFQAAGGQVVERRFENLDDVAALDEPVVVNCTGLGARALFGDEDLIPARGQLTYLRPQPEIDYGYVTGDGEGGTLYMFPRQTAIVLGGTYDYDEWDREPDPDVRHRMLSGHAAIARRISG